MEQEGVEESKDALQREKESTKLSRVIATVNCEEFRQSYPDYDRPLVSDLDQVQSNKKSCHLKLVFKNDFGSLRKVFIF